MTIYKQPATLRTMQMMLLIHFLAVTIWLSCSDVCFLDSVSPPCKSSPGKAPLFFLFDLKHSWSPIVSKHVSNYIHFLDLFPFCCSNWASMIREFVIFSVLLNSQDSPSEGSATEITQESPFKLVN